MVGIEYGTAPAAPHRSARDVLDWGRVVVATLARAVVCTLLGMALWAAAPAIIGWHPTTVMTGSMEPRLHPGDVVVSRPVAPALLRTGQVLLYEDPDQPGELRMHRYVKNGANGTLITKGDANPADDSTPVARSAVRGVAFIRVPAIGAPIMWLREGEWKNVALLAMVVGVVLFLTTVDGSLRRLGDPDSGGSGGSGDGGSGGAGDGGSGGFGSGGSGGSGSGGAGAAGPAEAREGRRLHRASSPRRRPHLGRGVVGGVVVGATLVGAVLLPTAASAAAFARTTANPTSSLAVVTSVQAPTALTCTQSGNNAIIAWTSHGPTPAQFDVLAGTTVLTSTTGTVTTATLTPANATLALGNTYAITVRNDLVTPYTAAWSATSSTSVNVQVVSVLGAGSVKCV